MAGQLWVTNSLGGFMYSDELSKNLRTALTPLCKFRQFCDAKDASKKAKHKGELYHWNVYGTLAAGTRVLAETATIPEDNFTITQGTLTVTEYGRSVPFTQKLDNLSAHPVKEIIRKVLRFDAQRAFDCGAHAQFNACKLRVVPTAGTSVTAVTLTTNGTATLTNNTQFQKEHVGLVVHTMRERNIPGFAGDDYLALGWPTTYATLEDDLEAVSQYTTEGYKKIVSGEIGRYRGMRFVEQTCIPKGGAADSGTYDAWANTADAWDNAKSDWIYFLGEDTVTEGIVVPEEMRGKIPSDYGRSMGVAWYYLGGFGLVHTDAANGRIIKWDSAS